MLTWGLIKWLGIAAIYAVSMAGLLNLLGLDEDEEDGDL